MSEPSPNPSPPPGNEPATPSLLDRLWSGFQFLLALSLTGATLVWLLYFPPRADDGGEGRPDRPPPAVIVVGPGRICIDPASKLYEQLAVVTLESRSVRDAILNTSGTVVASLRPGAEKGVDYWQVNVPELLTAYPDCEKAKADVTFASTQLKAIRELADVRVKAQNKVVSRLAKLVEIGTDSQKDLDTENANLLQFTITGRKDTYEAETAVRIARRNEAALTRQLQQAGLEPDLLGSITSDDDIVMAEVPEARVTRIKVGQQCEARFFGVPNKVFSGEVARLSPVVTRERRTLRVLFKVKDLDDQLRPGMFAEIGLGTDRREVLRVPAEAVVHVGRADYVIVVVEGDLWQVREVEVGEQQGKDVDIYSGLEAGDKFLGRGAILLKPFIIQATQPEQAPAGKGNRP